MTEASSKRGRGDDTLLQTDRMQPPPEPPGSSSSSSPTEITEMPRRFLRLKLPTQVASPPPTAEVATPRGATTPCPSMSPLIISTPKATTEIVGSPVLAPETSLPVAQHTPRMQPQDTSAVTKGNTAARCSPQLMSSPLSFPVTPQGLKSSLSGAVASPIGTPLSIKSSPETVMASSRPSIGSGSSSGGTFIDRITGVISEALRQQEPDDALLPPSASITTVAHAIATAISGMGPSGGVHCRTVLIPALRDPLNFELRKQIRQGALSPADLVKMSEVDLKNPEIKKEIEQVKDRCNENRNVQALKAAMAGPPSKMFRCPKCGNRRCSMEQRATRGDEPMKVILTCLECECVFRR